MSGESADILSHLLHLVFEGGQDTKPSGLPAVVLSGACMQPWMGHLGDEWPLFVNDHS